MKLLLTTGGFALLLVFGSVFFGCLMPDEEAVPFSMQVIPESVEDAIPGQRCVFLVTVEDEGGIGGAVSISAIVLGASVTVNPQAITPGQVAEVTVIPDELTNIELRAPNPGRPDPGPVTPDEDGAGRTIAVIIFGRRGRLRQIGTATVKVSAGEDSLAPYATELRDKFIPWLAANHPELGITDETEWLGTVVRPNIVVVMYYLFFSEDWEMGLRWHVTIPPHDWAEVYLRHRTNEATPSYAFKITSLTAQDDPDAVDLPEPVWR